MALQEILKTVQAWFDEQARSAPGKTVGRTSLQIGIFHELLFDYQPGRSSLDVDLGFGQETPSMQAPLLQPAQVEDELVPALAQAFRQALVSADPALLDYHFRLRATFPTTEGQREWLVLDLLDEAKRQALLARIKAYIDSKLSAGSYAGKPLESFFLSRHLLDPQLFPEPDAASTIALFERMQQLPPGRRAKLAEHRGNIIRAGTSWAEDCFLPQHFEIRRNEYRGNDYTIKPGAQDSDDDGQIALLLYVAVLVLRHEPSYAKPTGLQFIKLATQLGSARAARMLTEGSGSFAQDAVNLATDQVSCSANDVFATITIRIKQEGAEAYAQALDFVTHLLENGFPKSYQVKLKSTGRNYLPVKGLARSDTHRFFANALAWPQLHPRLARYARSAIVQYEFYADTDDEKNCMPGSYATFGLALADTQWFALLEQYMAAVDEEHQSVQDSFTAAFAAQHAVTATSIATLVTCLRHCTDDIKLKITPAFDDDGLLELLYQQLQGLESYEVEHVLQAIWGKPEKLAALARKAQGRRQQLLNSLSALTPR
ncbi:DUF6138 family protein [Janthinobacterium sp. RB2R34]|uniref:DUF6138 family protein n=1 Tax=Janthinobacterium sp. RB2R34 TaxID=3424193 RepID=UPI003F219145